MKVKRYEAIPAYQVTAGDMIYFPETKGYHRVLHNGPATNALPGFVKIECKPNVKVYAANMLVSVCR